MQNNASDAVVLALLEAAPEAVNQQTKLHPQESGDAGPTALMLASSAGRLDLAQLLSAYGANRTLAAALSQDGHSYDAVGEAADAGHAHLMAWFQATDGHSNLRIAIGCRHQRAARWLLRHGRADPDDEPSPCGTLRDAATRVGGWPGAPAVCRATVALAVAATKPWSPERHWLFHGGAREAVLTVLTCAHRLACADDGSPAGQQIGVSAAGLALPPFPRELWLMVLGHSRRRHWATPKAWHLAIDSINGCTVQIEEPWTEAQEASAEKEYS